MLETEEQEAEERVLCSRCGQPKQAVITVRGIVQYHCRPCSSADGKKNRASQLKKKREKKLGSKQPRQA